MYLKSLFNLFSAKRETEKEKAEKSLLTLLDLILDVKTKGYRLVKERRMQHYVGRQVDLITRRFPAHFHLPPAEAHDHKAYIGLKATYAVHLFVCENGVCLAVFTFIDYSKRAYFDIVT